MTPGTCMHFRGLRGTSHDCALGLDIREVTGGPQFGIGLRIPCMTRLFNGAKKVEKATCAKFVEPTAEQIADFEADLETHSKNATLARKAIIWHAGRTRGFVQSKLPCPICQAADLHYRIEPNGHVRAQCLTKDCVNFIE